MVHQVLSYLHPFLVFFQPPQILSQFWLNLHTGFIMTIITSDFFGMTFRLF